MSSRGLIAILVLMAGGCAEPNLYREPDGGEGGVDAGVVDAAPVADQGASDRAPGEVVAVDAAVGPDLGEGAADTAAAEVDGGATVEVGADAPRDQAIAPDAPAPDTAGPDVTVAVDTAPPCTRCSDGSCMKSRWDFESGTLEGAYFDPLQIYIDTPFVSLAPMFTGRQSLALNIPSRFRDGFGLVAAFPVCPPNTTANLRDATFRLKVFFEPDPGSTGPLLVQLFMQEQVLAIVQTSHTSGSWAFLEGKIPAAEKSDVNELVLYVSSVGLPMWTGRVWVDDLRID